MKLEWHGTYFDGRTAARREAKVRLTPSGAEIIPEGSQAVFWPYQEMRQTQGSYPGEQLRLERDGELGETLLMTEPKFLASLHRLAPELTKHFRDRQPRRIRTVGALLAAAAAIGLIAALYLWGIPALAAAVAPYIPPSWEEQLGKAVIDHLAPVKSRCSDATRTAAIETILTALTTRGRRVPYTLRVIAIKEPTVNALAAPGGYIVVFQGLLEQTQTAEELAGVLAHEVQHILKQHATRAVLEHASAGILLAALLGDTSGIGTFGLEGARILGVLRYSRRNEQEADAEGMRMLIDAGIDPAGMIAFFETMKKMSGPQPQILTYLSTHPNTEDRIESLRSIAAASQQKPQKLLPHRDWKDIRNLCSASAGDNQERQDTKTP